MVRSDAQRTLLFDLDNAAQRVNRDMPVEPGGSTAYRDLPQPAAAVGRGIEPVRRVLFWMHLGAGVLISCLVLFFAITGALLAYERPILHAADKRFYASDRGSAERVRLCRSMTLAAGAMAAVPSAG